MTEQIALARTAAYMDIRQTRNSELTMTITPIYAALVTFLYVYLTVMVISARRNTKTILGDGGHQSLQSAIRAHGNFAEYVPLALVLMALAELQDKPDYSLHFIGIVLLIARLLHPFGLSQDQPRFKLRVTGMVLTFVALVSGALVNLGITDLFGAS